MPPDKDSLYNRFLKFFGYGYKEDDILDVLLHERAPFLVNRPLLSFLAHLTIYPLLRYARSMRIYDFIKEGADGLEVIDRIYSAVPFKLEVEGQENIPEKGLAVVIANHPTGISDGIVLHRVLKEIRQDYIFLANRDAIRAVPVLEELIIPVEVVDSKKTMKKIRSTAESIIRSAQNERLLVVFPSGRLAYMLGGKLTERDWHTTALQIARKYNAPIIPFHIDCRNSSLFYLLSRLSLQLRDACIFYEVINKTDALYKVKCAPAVMPDLLNKDLAVATEQLKKYVAGGLAEELRPSA